MIEKECSYKIFNFPIKQLFKEVIMSVSGLSTFTQSIVHSVGPLQISNTVKNLHKFAIPLITLAGLANVNSVEAGPISYAGCILGCELLATSATAGVASVPALQACIYSCLPILAAPWCP